MKCAKTRAVSAGVALFFGISLYFSGPGAHAASAEAPSPSPSPKTSIAPEISPTPESSPEPAPSPTVPPAKKKPKKKTKKKKPKPAVSPAVPAITQANLPPLLRAVEDKYTQSQTLIAEFTQVNQIIALKQSKTSSGRIVIKRPNKVRWETNKPDSNLLVSDGKTFWFYTPPFDSSEHGQLIERKSTEVQSRLAQALLAGSFSIAKDMSIEPISDSEFRLTPKPRAAGTVETAEIRVDPDKKEITQVTLKHRGGNTSVITLSNIQLGEKLDDEVFVFNAPPGTDRIDE